MYKQELIGRKIKGFEFESYKYNLYYCNYNMGKNVDKEGDIKEYCKDNDSYVVDFGSLNEWRYPAELIERHLIPEDNKNRTYPLTPDEVPVKYVKRFPSGAVRSDSRGKTRFDFLSPYALELVAKHHTKNSDDFNNEDEFGANYFKGIKPRDIEPSLLRHINDLRIAILEKDSINKKEELIAVASNALMALHQIVLEEKGLYKEIYDKIEYVPAETTKIPTIDNTYSRVFNAMKGTENISDEEVYSYIFKKTQDLGDSLLNSNIWPEPFPKPTNSKLGINFSFIDARNIPYNGEGLLPLDEIENEEGEKLQYTGAGHYRFVSNDPTTWLVNWFSKWRKV